MIVQISLNVINKLVLLKKTLSKHLIKTVLESLLISLHKGGVKRAQILSLAFAESMAATLLQLIFVKR